MKKAWSGRFREETHPLAEAFTASISVDRRLYRHDVQGSIAHCRMLARQHLITRAEAAALIAGLEEVAREIEAGRFPHDPRLEDIHLHIERRLQDKVGEVAGKLHTARSRNDQVALDLRLYLREETREVLARLLALQAALTGLAREHLDVIVPGYTHLRRAQPVLLGHHWLAYYEMFRRDLQRFVEVHQRINVLPLGAGALAGTSLPIDRRYVAKLLGFPKVAGNSLDAVSDRDFAIEWTAAAALCMLHVSRLSEELVLWSGEEFGFLELPEAFCTGSSMLPHKVNPDVAELARGKAGRVFGALTALLTLMKGLPLAYNRDMQEDKPALFDAVDTLKETLAVFAAMLPGVRVTPGLAKGLTGDFMLSVDLAEYLVQRGLPFRTAHEVVGRLVRYCMDKEIGLANLTLDEMRRFSDRFAPDALARLSLHAAVNARRSAGGTARVNVLRAVKGAEAELVRQRRRLAGTAPAAPGARPDGSVPARAASRKGPGAKGSGRKGEQGRAGRRAGGRGARGGQR
ncbi:MAG: argininosuccinate lyase [Deltaproteobacteria bacterium]|nr:argininosuccinate lyase [Deltaproteobacteria bacterium]